MKVRNLIALALSAALVVGFVSQVVMGQARTDVPKAATTKPADEIRNVRLVIPFSLLGDLSPEQATKLKDIRKHFLEEQKKLEVQCKEDSLAVLTDAQKTELQAIEKERASKEKENKENKENKEAPPVKQ